MKGHKSSSLIPNRREGLTGARVFMVLSSLSPLFALWAIRGTSLIPDGCFITACAIFVLIPYGVLWHRMRKAYRENDRIPKVMGYAEDNQSHILVYLFAILLPFYREEIETYRDLAAMVVALMFIVFLFWRLNLHYINILFALSGYRVFTVFPPPSDNPYSSQESFVLITFRRSLTRNMEFDPYRISNTVYFERKPDA